MTEVLPLFPLGTVLFPGLVLPLHVFEERYRALVRDLLELPEDQRRFGVVAIRQGREVGRDGITALHEVGCTARVMSVETGQDGTSDLVTVGADRFVLRSVGRDRAYLTGEVDWLPDELGSPELAAVLDPAVRTAFLAYLDALGTAGGGTVAVPELPDDPLVLGHLVGVTMLLDLDDRQALLAAADGRDRLRAELSLLRRETGLLTALTAAPAPELARTVVSPN